MQRRKASILEFAWQANELVHRPSGARFVVRPGTREISMMLLGLLKTELGDGQDYDIASVMDLAWTLVQQRDVDG